MSANTDALETPSAGRVVVAMSGGVDSSAAAMMLADQGYEVIGIAMQVWDYRKNGGTSTRATCCAPGDFDDARQVADARGFPFYVFDFEDSFHDAVIAPFVKSYLKGLTPNPCLDCNRKVKFRELRRRARTLGADKVATGHYAQVLQTASGRYRLVSSRDRAKDQSYFLYALTQSDLSQTLFPVGDMVKSDVRAYLANAGQSVASKGESQDICFVSNSVPEFIESQTGQRPSSGRLVSSSGEVLGEHEGIHRFTVGQRRGLRVSAREPLYVLNIVEDSNDVVVGSKAELERETFYLEETNWIAGEAPAEPIEARVKLRYRHGGVRCRITPEGDGRSRLDFLDTWTAVSPGQAAVFYSLDPEPDGTCEVLGGGIITKG